MYISKLTMRNFRNFRSAAFKFGKGVNTLIGENGSGKTNAFYAIRLLIDSSLPRAVQLAESDFTRSIPDGWKGHWIIIQLEFSDLDDSEGIQMLSHGVEHMDGTSTGSYCMYFRPNYTTRKRLHELSVLEATKDELREVLNGLSLVDYEIVFTCKGTTDFSDDGIYAAYVGDFENVEFPDPDDEYRDVLGVPPLRFSIYNEVTCTYIKALRDAEYELRTVRNNPLLNLMKDMSQKIDDSTIVSQVTSLNSAISSLDEIQAMRNQVQLTLHNAVGTTYAPTIDIKSQLPDDMEKLLQSLTLWVGDSEDGDYQGQVRELSLGGTNLIYITLKLLEYELKQSMDKAAHFLLIEEPEAHIHTHIQKTLFEKYGNHDTQIIISTHSTHISSASKISSVNILAKRSQEAAVFQPGNGLSSVERSSIERYLDAIRSTLLFAKGVILVEGDAELILIPNMFKQVFDMSLDEIGISLISMNSTVFTHIALLFHDDRIQRQCAIITDLDKSIVPLSEDDTSDDSFTRDCRNSQVSGLRRKEKLDRFCETNRWVRPFYATYTFEVDFVMNRNSWEVIRSLESIYSQQRYIQESKEKLEEETPEVSGKEILHLAEKVGKGWLALLITENVSCLTNIPRYIMEAIAFAWSHVTPRHFEVMADYRIQKGMDDELHGHSDVYAELYAEKEKLIERKQQSGEDYIEDYLQLYKRKLPDDQLTELMILMGR